MAYETIIQVYFGDVDPAHIVYYPNIFHYCHVAFERFFADFVGIPYPQLIESERLGFPAVKVASDFRKRIKYGEDIRLQVTVARLGNSSVEFCYHGRSADGDSYFQANVTVVAVDMDTFKPVAVPAKYREIFARCFLPKQ
jgi:4-hydroxybenzoyl-CoA thioesterase